MAHARQTSVKDKIADVTECSICTEVFKSPKVLPCVHTFCLHCLEKYGNGKNPGNQMVCPICRNEFIIPNGGLCNLPNNFLIGKMVEIGKLALKPINKAICDICPEGEEAVATMICVDCEEILCDRCSKSHKKAKFTQNHHVVELGGNIYANKLNFRNSYCDLHPKELIKMYCYNDNEAICLICSAESHDSHKRVNIDKVAGEFKQRLEDDLGKAINRIPDYEEAWKKLQKYKEVFTEYNSETEKSIRDQGKKLKELIDQNTEILVQNMKSARDHILKDIQIAIQDVERFRVMIESFSKYCEELLSRGSAVDICRAADQMHSRAKELENLPANCSGDYFHCNLVAFHPSRFEHLLEQSESKNAVGDLSITKSPDGIIGFETKNTVIQAVASKQHQFEKKVARVEPCYQLFKTVRLEELLEKSLERKRKRISENVTNLRPFQLALVRTEEFRKQLEQECPDLEFEVKQNKVNLCGLPEVARKAKLFILEKVTSCVQDSFETTETTSRMFANDEAMPFLIDQLHSQDISASWRSNERSVDVFTLSETNLKAATEILRKAVIEEHIQLDKASQKLVQSSQWKDFIRRLYNDKKSVEVTVMGSTVVATSTSDVAKFVGKELNIFIEKHAILEKVLLMNLTGTF